MILVLERVVGLHDCGELFRDAAKSLGKEEFPVRFIEVWSVNFSFFVMFL